MHCMTISLLFTSRLLSLLALAVVFFACQNKPQEAKETARKVTYDNLQTAYGKSINRSKMYKKFVTQAEKENLKNIAALYRAIARSEEIHAAAHAKLLRAGSIEPIAPAEEVLVIGKTLQTLKMALSYEEQEYGSMYPHLLRSATAEKFQDAITQFQHIQDADAKHGELLRDAITKNGAIPPMTYYVCPECGYLMLSDKAEECPACQTKKGKFERI
jgi:rubrerythrin